MRYHVPEAYSDPHIVPPEFLGPFGVPTLGWLAQDAASALNLQPLESREQTVLQDAARGVLVMETAFNLGISHDAVERTRASATARLLGTSILHAVRIGIEIGIVPTEHPKPGQTIPYVHGQNVETFDLLSRGYTTKQVAKLQGIRSATVHSRMKPVYRELGVKGLVLTTTTGYDTGLLHHLTLRQQLPADDPILSAIA